MIKAEDLGDFYRIAADTRDLNYNKYFSEGQKKISKGEYNSNNTHQLNVEEMKELLLKLPEIQSELNG